MYGDKDWSPLLGYPLIFDVDIVDIRVAFPAYLAHRDPHGIDEKSRVHELLFGDLDWGICIIKIK